MIPLIAKQQNLRVVALVIQGVIVGHHVMVKSDPDRMAASQVFQQIFASWPIHPPIDGRVVSKASNANCTLGLVLVIALLIIARAERVHE